MGGVLKLTFQIFIYFILFYKNKNEFLLLQGDPGYVDAALAAGTAAARDMAEQTMVEVRAAVGLAPCSH